MKNLIQKQDVQTQVISILRFVQRYNGQFNTEQAAECFIGVKPEIYGVNPYFNTFSEQNFQEFCNLIDYLVQHEYIKYVNLVQGKLEISFRGMNFLIAPKAFLVSNFVLKKQIHFSIIQQLREKRKTMAVEARVPIYRIASNHILRMLSIYKPQTIDELFDLHADFVKWDFPTNWNELLCCLQDSQLSAFQHVSESMKETQKLLESGLTTNEIAKYRNLSKSTILWHLEVLHYQEYIDLTSWIELQIEPLKLNFQANYFKKSGKKKLRDATKYLKISFEEARLSRMYSWHQPVI